MEGPDMTSIIKLDFLLVARNTSVSVVRLICFSNAKRSLKWCRISTLSVCYLFVLKNLELENRPTYRFFPISIRYAVSPVSVAVRSGVVRFSLRKSLSMEYDLDC